MNRLALVVVSFLIGGAAAWSLASRTEPAPVLSAAEPIRPAIQEDAGRWEEVLAALARIEAPAQAEQSTGELEEVLSELDELKKQLARAQSVPAQRDADGGAESTGPGYDLLTLKKTQPKPNWKALKQLIQQWNRDEQAARQSAQLLGYRDVLELYGNPTEVWGTNESLNWLYVDGIDAFTGETVVEVWFQFVDGFVVQLGVKQP